MEKFEEKTGFRDVVSDELNDLSAFIHSEAVSRGFYDKEKELGTAAMLTVTEISEMVEADRKGRRARLLEYYDVRTRPGVTQSEVDAAFKAYVKDTLEDEWADAFIRHLDFAGWLGIDVAEFVRLKLEYNHRRPKLHGKLY